MLCLQYYAWLGSTKGQYVYSTLSFGSDFVHMGSID